jgi:hypothetical protein
VIMWQQVDADRQAHQIHAVARTGIHGIYSSRFCKGKAKIQRRSQCYPQPCCDFCPELHYLSGDVVSAPLPPHLFPGVRRCGAIGLCLGGKFGFLGDPSSNLPSLSTRLFRRHQRAHVIPDGLRPSFPSLPTPFNFLVLADAP